MQISSLKLYRSMQCIACVFDFKVRNRIVRCDLKQNHFTMGSCSIPGSTRNPARPAHKNCVHSASVRCAYSTTSLRVDRVIIAFRSEKESVRHRDHASFAPNSRERNFKVSEKFRRAARTKVSWTRPAWLQEPQNFVAALCRVGVRSNAR